MESNLNNNPNIPVITNETTLGELLSMLNLGERPKKVPTSKAIRISGEEPIAIEERCKIYPSGFAVYDNGSGRTVIWLPDCVRFSYDFVKAKNTDDLAVSDTYTLPTGSLESLPWPIPVTLIGDHRVEENLMNRTGSRKGTKDYDADDKDDKDGDTEEAMERLYMEANPWMDGRYGEDPLQTVLREEWQKEVMERLTKKQQQVCRLYYIEGYSQDEISKILGVGRSTVAMRLELVLKKIKNIF